MPRGNNYKVGKSHLDVTNILYILDSLEGTSMPLLHSVRLSYSGIEFIKRRDFIVRTERL